MLHNLDFNKLCEAAKKQPSLTLARSSSAHSYFSFGIVNSEANGKRLSFSKALVASLGLDKTVAMLPIPVEGVIMLARELPFDGAISGELRGSEKKLWYASSVVLLLTELFDLDFKPHVSRSFSDISINDLDGVPVATVSIAPDTHQEDAIA